jgi:GAF domain-containing protein
MPPPNLEAIARITHELLAEPKEKPTLERVVRMAIETIDGCDYAGVSLRRGKGRVETPAATHQVVADCDALQYELSEGPCLDAISHRDTYVVKDTRTDPRWPTWCPRAAELGIGSILSVRLASTSETLGALNLYAARHDSFTSDDVDVAHVYASNAAVALVAAKRISGLETALETRHLIGVAQGILMQRYGLSLDRAFEVLRRYSSQTNIKLRDVAAKVVARGGLPEDEAIGPHNGVAVDDAAVDVAMTDGSRS